MSKTHSNSWLSSQYVNGIYIPSGLLLVGIAIVKADWTPYAALIALILGSWKIYQNRNSPILISLLAPCYPSYIFRNFANRLFRSGVKKCLKPDVFQEFPLKEKTVVSHNVAM
jgi:cytochrome-b5 reductase